MLVPFFLFAVFVIAQGQESSTAQPVKSSTPKTADVEKIDPQKNAQDRQNGNSLPFSNYQQQANPSQPDYQPRRLSVPALSSYDSRSPSSDSRNALAQPIAPNQTNQPRRRPAPENQSINQMRPTTAPNVPNYGVGSLPGEQPSYTYRPAQPSTQPRRIPSPDQSYYQSRPDELSYKPYSFNYVSEAEDGYHSHQQTGDDSGKVVGSYSFTLEDGRKRYVDYVADQNGFRANIDTNEPGTSMDKSPADVFYHSGSSRSAWPGSRSIVESGSRPNLGAGSYATQGISDSGHTIARSFPQGTGLQPQGEIPSYQGREMFTGRSPTTSYRSSEVPVGGMRPDAQGFQGNRWESGRPAFRDIQDSSVGPSSGFNRNDALGVERGPAFTSFLAPGTRPTADMEGERGAPNLLKNGESGSEGFGVAGRSASRNLESGVTNVRNTGDESAQRYARPNGDQGLGARGDFEKARALPSYEDSESPSYQPLNNEENVRVVDYHMAHPRGAVPYYYYLDNGNYWYHRH